MKSEFEVKYIVRDHKRPKLQSITHIGGELSSGDRWQIPIKEAIDGISSGRFGFTVTQNNNQVEQLMVSNHPIYGQMLKSKTDGRNPKALISLPERDVNTG
jgi:hypothetical protein